MSFTENLRVEIESVFDSKGFEKFEQRMKSARAQVVGMSQLFQSARKNAGLRKFGREFNDRMDRAGFKVQNINDKLGGTGPLVGQISSALSEMGVGAENFDSWNQAVGEARRQLNQFDGIVTDSNGNLVRSGQMVEAMTNQFDDLGAMIENMPEVKPFEKEGQGRFPMEQFQGGGGDSPMANLGFAETEGDSNRLSRAMFRLGRATNLSSRNMDRLGFATAKASSGFAVMSAMASRAGDSLRSVSFNAQQVQMQLLGLQFQLLSLAFIFGGLMMSAMGAVGIFKILGNTLKMFFLPTALELLPVMLDIRDAILSVGEDTRKQVGRIFLIVAVLSTLGSLAAFVLNGLLAVGSALWSLSAPIRFVVRYFTKGGRILAYLGRTLVTVTSFLYGLVAGFLGAMQIFKIFGDMWGLLINLLLAGAGIFAVVASAITLPFWGTAAVIGAVIGIIAGIIWKFKDTVMSILGGLAKFIMKWGGKLLNFMLWPFKKAYEMIVGNSIIPDLVNDVVSWFFKLPGKIVGLGTSIVETIANGIANTGDMIWNTFKDILPDFLVDAIEGAGKAVKGIVETGGDIVGAAGKTIGKVGEGLWEGAKDFGQGAMNAAGDFASGVSNTVSNLTSGGGNNGGNQTNVQQNNVDATVEVNDKEETPQETGRQFGQGFSNSLNSRQSDFASGT